MLFYFILEYFQKWKSHLSIACEWISWKENSRLFHMVPYSVPERCCLETFLALKKWPLCFSNKCQLLWVSVGEPYKSVPSSWTFLLEKWMTVFSLLHSSKFWQRSQHWKQIKFLKIHKASSLCHSTRTTFWILPTFFFCLHLIVLYNYPSIILDYVDHTMSPHSGRSPQFSMWEKTSHSFPFSNSNDNLDWFFHTHDETIFCS